jgi:hypothetical protein
LKYLTSVDRDALDESISGGVRSAVSDIGTPSVEWTDPKQTCRADDHVVVRFKIARWSNF